MTAAESQTNPPARLMVIDSTISYAVLKAGAGGGIANESTGKVTVCDSNIQYNEAFDSGDGIANESTGSLEISGSTIEYNHGSPGYQPAGNGAGIANASTGTVSIRQSTIEWNVAWNGANGLFGDGGGIANESTGLMTVADSTVEWNGALNGSDVDNGGGGVLTLTDSTLGHGTTFCQAVAISTTRA